MFHEQPVYKQYMILQEMTDWAEEQRQKLLNQYARQKKQTVRQN